MKKMQFWWPLLFSLTLIAGMWIGYRLSRNIPESEGFFRTSRTSSLQEVITLLKTRYVDSVNTDSLSENAIQAMLANLDPHTLYIPAVYTAQVNEDLQGNFEGIGVEYFIIKDTVHTINVLKDGPSDKAGLKTGDKFIKVGDSVVAGNGITSDRIRKLLRGESGSTVKVTLMRANTLVDTLIRRGTIPTYAVDAAYMIDQQTGFIHLTKFSRTAYEEFMQALEKLKEQGMKKLIFDLRGNGGGILDEAVDIVDEFLEGDRLVVYTKGLHAERRDYKCKRPGQFEKGELVVLMDEFSASASEVVAGALQDWDRATIVGRRSYGKGLVQEPFDLVDGSQLRLTVAKYYSPSGRNIQKPFDGNRSEYRAEVYHRQADGHEGDTTFHSGPAFKTLLKQRVVYGGGGIMPDYYIPLDTTRYSSSLSALFSQQRFNKFIYQYYLDHQGYFNQFKTPAAFAKAFQPNEESWKSLQQFSLQDSINLNSISATDRQQLTKRFRSFMALQLWRMEGYYELTNQDDAVVSKALELVR